MRYYRMLKNRLLLLLGFTLCNNRSGKRVYVKLVGFKQVTTNPNRKNKPYSLDDEGWVALWNI